MILTEKQKKFADGILARLEDVKKARKRKVSKSFKAIPNTEKISVTRTGIYIDSYLSSIPSALERLCRLRASTLIELMLDDGPQSKRKKLVIHGKKVKLSTPSVHDLFRIMRYQKQSRMVCVGCGCEAKYVYVERTISLLYNGESDGYGVAFYCVHPNGSEHRMTVDHVNATAEGGKNVLENKQILCDFCNSVKSSMPNDVFMESRGLFQNFIKEKIAA